MAVKLITPKQERYIRKHFTELSSQDLANKLNIPRARVRNFIRREGLTLTKEQATRFRVEKMKGRTSCTPEMDEVIKRDYLTVSPQKIADKIGKSETSVKNRMRQLGLVIPREIVEQRIRDSRIQKGAAPPNKGKKWADYLSEEQQDLLRKTQFKKGEDNHNNKYDGCISIRHDHTNRHGGKTYKYIRLSKGKWKQLHVKVWEDANGPVPKGHAVVFKDGNTMNIVLDNLELVTRVELMRRNTIHRYPAELKHTIKILKKLKKQIDEKQDQ